ncbi:MFS transporter [Rhodobacteraceae bacterium 2CG4]|uniref:MFS transporter n=1 Tax=Halovulum marinum TaxID=2662447 RepID=A0A6L5Z1F8_9RHOB|nr:MFS transporter [Halovulum marinum]MSU90387.1 MFS transporter [Halovulum marinum]
MSAAAEHDSRYSWVRLGLTLLIATVGNAGMWAIIVVLPQVQAEFGVGRAGAALPYTLTMVGYALGNLLIGRAVDRFGVTAALSAAALGLGAGFAAAAAAPSLMVLSAVQLLIGICTAASFGPLIADISHWFLRRRGIAVAVAASGNYLSGAIWPTALAGTLTEHGWRGAYLTLAVVSVAAMLPLAQTLRRRLSAEATGRARADAAGRARTVRFPPARLQRLLALAGVGCCVAMSMPQVHIVALSVDLGYGPAAGAQMLSLMLLGGVASRLVSGFLADALGGVRTLLIGSALQCLALFLYLPFDGLMSLYVVSLVFGLSQGGIVPSYAIVVREYMPPAEAGARVGFVIMATIVGMALGGWMSGWIHDLTGSYRMAFLNGIAWNMLNILILLAILLRSQGRRAPAAA